MRPVAGAAGDVRTKLLEQRRALRRVHHLGMELHAVELALIVGDRRERRAGRDADGAEAGRQPRTRSPWLIHTCVALALLEHAVEQRRFVDHLKLGAAELA